MSLQPAKQRLIAGEQLRQRSSFSLRIRAPNPDARPHAAYKQYKVELEEVRRILQRAVATPERLGDLAVRLFSPAYGGPELELPPRNTHEPPELR